MIPLAEPIDMSREHLLLGLIDGLSDVVTARAAELDDLDAAIGDGDHGTNMRRGVRAIAEQRRAIAALPLPEALATSGRAAVMSIGGAAGPLYGTLLLALGEALAGQRDGEDLPAAFAFAVAAVGRRGRSTAGQKTLLDVLGPLSEAMLNGQSLNDLAAGTQRWAEATRAMQAVRGRAAFLGERSIGHVDPGAASAAMLAERACLILMEARSST